MWLKNFQFNNKTLSDVELLVLSNIPEQDFVEATTLIDQLTNLLPHWNPERGTIYPLLHRLTAQKLLTKSPLKGNLQFKRTEYATTFLSSLITSNGLLNQFDTSIQYLHIIANSMIDIDAFATEKFLTKFHAMAATMTRNIERFQEMTKDKIKKEEWVEIDIE